MNTHTIRALAFLLFCSVYFASCKSNSTSPTPVIPPAQTITINGTDYAVANVSEFATQGYYELDATTSTGNYEFIISMNARPSASGIYTASVGNPTGSNCVVTLLQNVTTSYAALTGGSVAVTVSGSNISYVITNMTMKNVQNLSDTKTLSINVSTN